jgi:DNA-binding CsgD family transcriptional regulator
MLAIGLANGRMPGFRHRSTDRFIPPRREAGASADATVEWPARLGGDIGDALVHIRAPAYVLDRNGLIRWENIRAIEVFGDHRGSHFTVLVAPEFLARTRVEFTKKVIGNARTSDYESVLRTRFGDEVPVEIRAVALRDDNHVVGIFGIVDLAEELEPQGRPLPAPVELTPRQREVLRSLARGCSTAQIAETLGVARETVRNHVRGLLRALRVNSRLAAIAEARRLGLID